jgi:hypothetical protein
MPVSKFFTLRTLDAAVAGSNGGGGGVTDPGSPPAPDPPPPLDGARGFAVDVEYLVDASTYEPVQVTLDRGAGGKSVITFETFERLPMDPALLRIP